VNVPHDPEPPPEGLDELEKAIVQDDFEAIQHIFSRIFVQGPGLNRLANTETPFR
jgi:hypothetical protein